MNLSIPPATPLIVAGLFWSLTATAGELPDPAAGWLAPGNPCAIYGVGYVAVHGAGECAQIRDRIRVETVAPPLPSSFTPPAGVAAQDRLDSAEGPARAHLRLNGPGGLDETPRTR